MRDQWEKPLALVIGSQAQLEFTSVTQLIIKAYTKKQTQKQLKTLFSEFPGQRAGCRLLGLHLG